MYQKISMRVENAIPVRRSKACENSIHGSQPDLIGRNSAAHLRKNHDKARLAQKGGLSAHVRATQQQDFWEESWVRVS